LSCARAPSKSEKPPATSRTERNLGHFECLMGVTPQLTMPDLSALESPSICTHSVFDRLYCRCELDYREGEACISFVRDLSPIC